MTAPDLFAALPYAGFLGLRSEAAGGELLGVMPFSEHLVGDPTVPALHGGALGAFLELTAVAELARRGEAGGSLPRTIGVTVEYLRSGRARDTYARAEVKRLGRRIANVAVEAWQDDRAKPVALLYGRFLLSRRADAPAAAEGAA